MSDDEEGEKHWRPVRVQNDYVISGGVLSRPHYVETLVRGTDVFVAVRRYEVWVSQMVMGKSRRDDPLKNNDIWMQMVDAAEGESMTSAPKSMSSAHKSALADNDPMAEILADMDDTREKRKVSTPKPKVKRDMVVTVRANGHDFRVYVPDRKQSKTVWLHKDDVGPFMKIVAGNVQEKAPRDIPLGLMWLDGKSQWVARWIDDEGATQEVAVSVLRHRSTKLGKILLDQELFKVKMDNARSVCRAKAEAMGMPAKLFPDGGEA